MTQLLKNPGEKSQLPAFEIKRAINRKLKSAKNRQLERTISIELQKRWPTVKFRTVAGQNSLETYYTDGPTEAEVKKVLEEVPGNEKAQVYASRSYSEAFPYIACRNLDLTKTKPDVRQMAVAFKCFLRENGDREAIFFEVETIDKGEFAGYQVKTKASYCCHWIEDLQTAIGPLGYTMVTTKEDGYNMVAFLNETGMRAWNP